MILYSIYHVEQYVSDDTRNQAPAFLISGCIERICLAVTSILIEFVIRRRVTCIWDSGPG